MSNGHTLQITGRGIAVIIGVICLIFTFVPDIGIAFAGRFGLFFLGGFLILAGIR